MSTKTTFKRIALVAVAALGLGVISVAPSSAAVGTSATVTVAAGTATTKVSDSSTAETVAVTYLAGQTIDSVAVSAVIKSVPTGQTAFNPVLMWVDSATAQPSVVTKTPATAAALAKGETVSAAAAFTLRDSDTTTVPSYVTGNFKVFLDTSAGATGSARTLLAGTYTISVIVTPYDNGTANLTNQKVGKLIWTNTKMQNTY